MSYTTKNKIQKYLAVDIASSFDSEVTNWIATVKTWIDNYVGKSFEITADSTEYYDGNGLDRLLVNDLTSVTSLDILDLNGNSDDSLTEGAGNDYVLYPLNQTAKNEIVLMPNGTRSTFPSGKRRVKIVGVFGHSTTVPADIEFVATQLTAQIIRKGLQGGEISSVELGDYKASFNDIDQVADALGIYNVLDNYRDLHI